MARTTTHRDQRDRQTGERRSDVRTIARRFGAFNLVAGLLGLVGPLVWGNDDDVINVASGLFLGRIAVNGPHAVLHALHGLHGLRASRDAESARRYLGTSAAFFALFAAVGVGKFGLERGVHSIGGLAVDGYGNAGHAVLSAFCLGVLSRTESDS